jgi:hypothetical protein
MSVRLGRQVQALPRQFALNRIDGVNGICPFNFKARIGVLRGDGRGNALLGSSIGSAIIAR